MTCKIETALNCIVKCYMTMLLLLYLSFPAFSQETVFPNSKTSNESNTRKPVINSPQIPQEVGKNEEYRNPATDILYIILITALSIIGVAALLAAGFCWYRHKHVLIATERVLYRTSDSSVLIHNGGPQGQHEQTNEKTGAHHLSALAKRADYPAYGVTGPNPLHEQSYEKPAVDGVLNKGAEVYHYNQTKKRMKALSSSATSDSSSSPKHFDPQDIAAELEVNDEETSDGEYTVYECSGLAAAIDGPMEVHNPLFDDMLEKSFDNNQFSYKELGNTNGFHQNPSFISTSTAK